MRLTDLLIGNRQLTGTNNVANVSGMENANINQQIKALTPGQTIRGELIARNGNDAQIKLADDMVLQAKIDQNVALEEGTNLIFEVKNNGKALTLSPLFANTSTDINVLKALDMAGIPANESTVLMTTLMMKAGMSIDKNALQQMYRESNRFPEAELDTLVDLHKLGMDVNIENVNQMSSYKNLTHQLVDGMNEMFSSMEDTLMNMVESGDIKNAVNIYKDLIQLPFLEETQVDANGQEATVIQNLNAKFEEGTAVQNSENKVMVFAEINAEITSEEANVNVSAQMELEDNIADSRHQVLEDVGENVAGQDKQEEITTLQNSINTSTGVGEANKIYTEAQLLKLLDKSIQTGDFKELNKALKDSLKDLWTIEPKDVADEHKVEKLYQRLEKQLKTVMNSLEQANQTDSGAYKATANLSQNIDFLHQFNQMYAYVQLPLKLQNGQANGDLYVYTNKKNMAMKDGNITALLHLDMEYLGPLDVYVSMKESNVNTKFTVADEEMLDFLEQHMDILTKRLNKRGYNLDVNMTVKDDNEKTNSGVRPILDSEGSVSIVKYAFDMRA